MGGLSPGAPSRLFPLPSGALAVAICYEIADGLALAEAVRDGALWLVASANLDPYPAQLQRQFAALAQLRAIETGRWLVSSANTGPSLVVDASGQVRRSLPMGIAGTLDSTVERRSATTAYVSWGPTPLLLLLSTGLLLRVSPARLGRSPL